MFVANVICSHPAQLPQPTQIPRLVTFSTLSIFLLLFCFLQHNGKQRDDDDNAAHDADGIDSTGKARIAADLACEGRDGGGNGTKEQNHNGLPCL